MQINRVSLLLLLLVPAVCSQSPRPTEEPGRISGIVVDVHDGHPLVYATVVVLDTGQGTSTKQQGRFTIKNVPMGIYTMKVLVMGYAVEIIENVLVKPNRTTELTFELKAIPVEVIPPITIERQPINWNSQ